MAQTIFTNANRASILINGVQYSVTVNNFYINRLDNVSLVGGMTTDGTNNIAIYGALAVEWGFDEFLPDLANYVDFKAYFLANTTNTIVMTPVSIDGAYLTAQKPFTLINVFQGSVNINLPDKNSPSTRSIRGIASDFK